MSILAGIDRIEAQLKSGPGSATNTVIPGPDHCKGVAMSKRTCSAPSCTEPHHARGLCAVHYAAEFRRGGLKSRGPNYGSPEEALRNRVERQGDCLAWTGAKNSDGYGLIKVKGRLSRAHRFAWEMKNGAIPEGAQIDHECWNPACVNVDHLRVATPSQNTAYTRGARSDSRTGVKNVTMVKGKYVVRMTMNGKAFHLGTFADLEEAANVAADVRRRIYGEFAGRI